MLKIYHYDEENFHIVFRIEAEEGIKIISKILARIKDDFYIDWLYTLEELNDRNPILFKKIDIKKISSGAKSYILITPDSKEIEILALIPV
ncbi:MAG TPA: hypothetical protein EYH43_06110 [Persephonella sp.]|nr:hypothetical protein [Hydrogenothermaceae bacterium]HIQ25538.1 hypothetical protein [Persephonella sp.]